MAQLARLESHRSMSKPTTPPARVAYPTRIDPNLAAAILNYMMTKYGMRRPPHAAARIVALICHLHDLGLPFPPRQAVADLVGCKTDGVDAALSVALSDERQDISIDLRLRPGNVRQRHSVIREKFYKPSHEISLINNALRTKIS